MWVICPSCKREFEVEVTEDDYPEIIPELFDPSDELD